MISVDSLWSNAGSLLISADAFDALFEEAPVMFQSVLPENPETERESFVYEYENDLISYNPKSEKVGTVWKTQIKKESSDF